MNNDQLENAEAPHTQGEHFEQRKELPSGTKMFRRLFTTKLLVIALSFKGNKNKITVYYYANHE